jgi:putative aldouronate transport system permease protein
MIASTSEPPAGAAVPRQARRAWLRRFLDKNGALLLMMAPGLLLLLVFNYAPMIGLVIAFKHYLAYQGLWGSAWVGLQNFQYLFGTSDAWHITYNTLFMNALFIVTVLIGSLGLALLLNEIRDTGRWLPKFYQSTLFVPYVLSYVLISYFVFALLSADSGLIDKWLTWAGLPSVDWYSSPEPWRVILTLVNLWKNAGFWSIVYLAGMLAISPEYYEAALMDGASKWNQIWTITLPLLTPLIIINLLLSIGRIFYADFGLFYQVPQNNGLLYTTTDVIDTYVFRSLTVTGDVGMAAAAGFYQAVVGFLLVVLSNWIVRRINPDRALF